MTQETKPSKIGKALSDDQDSSQEVKPREFCIAKDSYGIIVIQNLSPDFKVDEAFKVIEHSAYEALEAKYKRLGKTSVVRLEELGVSFREVKALEAKYETLLKDHCRLRAREINGTLRTYDGAMTEVDAKIKELEAENNHLIYAKDKSVSDHCKIIDSLRAKLKMATDALEIAKAARSLE